MEKHSDQWSPSEETRKKEIESSHETYSIAERPHVYNSIPHYSEKVAQALGKMLADKETFKEALQILITWLERNECNESNSTCFYFLIELCWNHVEKLQNEHKEYLKKIKEAEKLLLNKSCYIQSQLNEIEEIFKVMENKNMWGNFNQNQLEKMQEIRSDILDLKQNIMEGSVGNAVEGKESNDMNIEAMLPENKVHRMQNKLGSLTYELNTANQKAEDLKIKCKEYENEILRLRSELEKKKKLREKTNMITNGDNQQKNPAIDVASQCPDLVVQNEKHIISLISIFLFDHPDGVNIDCIYSHLNKYIPVTHAIDIENLLRKFPKLFKESSSVGTTQEKNWTFISPNPKTLTELLSN